MFHHPGRNVLDRQPADIGDNARRESVILDDAASDRRSSPRVGSSF
jgi:hypothetical protein